MMVNFKKIIKDIAKYSVRAVYILESYIIPSNEKVILFESSSGRNYAGSPRYIYEEMVNQGLDDEYKCVWSLSNTDIEIPGKAIKVKRSFFKYLFYTLRSGVWVLDSRHLYYLRKNKNTRYIQTWHGTPFKKLGLDMDVLDMSGNTDVERYREDFKRNTREWQYLLSQNEYSSEIFRKAFDFKGEMLEIGYPRNDILFEKNNESDIAEIKEKLNIPKNKKVILYAPTWRDNQYTKAGEYKFASAMDFDAFHENFKDDFTLIVKFHYLVKDKSIDWSKYDDFIIECDEEWDIQELYLISDIMITDYSSVMFDYAILKRPMIYFTYDIDDYTKNVRSFYFDIFEEAPGPKAETNEELIELLKNFDVNAYNDEFGEKYRKFNEKYNQFDDGTASKKVVELIKGN